MMDHARGCEGRNYSCTCGYDDAVTARIEQLEAFRQEVSDDVVLAISRAKSIKGNSSYVVNHMHKYIIAKPDPLADAVAECDDAKWETGTEYVACLRAAIEKRGGKIVWGEG